MLFLTLDDTPNAIGAVLAMDGRCTVPEIDRESKALGMLMPILNHHFQWWRRKGSTDPVSNKLSDKMRNTNIEIRNKYKITMFKCSKQKKH